MILHPWVHSDACSKNSGGSVKWSVSAGGGSEVAQQDTRENLDESSGGVTWCDTEIHDNFTTRSPQLQRTTVRDRLLLHRRVVEDARLAMLCGSCGHSASSSKDTRTLSGGRASRRRGDRSDRGVKTEQSHIFQLLAAASVSALLIYFTPLRNESPAIQAPLLLVQLLLVFVALPTGRRLRAAATRRLNSLAEQHLTTKFKVSNQFDFADVSVSVGYADFKRQHNHFWPLYVVSASVLVMSCVCKTLQPSQIGCVLMYFPLGVVDLMEGELVTRTNMPSLLALIVVAYVCTMWYMLIQPISVSMFGTVAMHFGPMDVPGAVAWGMSYCLSWSLRVLCPTPMKMSKTLEVMALLCILKIGSTCAHIWAAQEDGQIVPDSAWSQIEVDITVTGVSAVVIAMLRLHMEEKNMTSFLHSHLILSGSSMKKA
uniref:Uncharacterized protein n=1 Tax=Tetraselmis chuii TaxID=63592 RepID=A0A7S1SZY5_9CHLO|mmetsp:Transcript_38183/g.68480  ORF Transcript_38183/g.68480 Transcript_38183/m.68480 type:complete len:427 (+) Transcript_38183:59-1339(+)